MAKFVLAGKADCPYFAKAELLADKLEKMLPNFHIHKIIQHPDEWERWLQEMCQSNGWVHSKSPIVWRELLDRGGKGLLLGGFNDFLEHAQIYYGVTSDMPTDTMLDIATENLETCAALMEEKAQLQSQVESFNVWVTSALSLAAYALTPFLCNGDTFGQKRVSLHLLDGGDCEEQLCALKMELEDTALPPLLGVEVHSDLHNAFLDAHVVIFLDEVEDEGPNQQTPESQIERVAQRYQEYGHLIDSNAHRDVRVVVAATVYANLKCCVLAQSAPSFPSGRFVALATHIENRVKHHLATKMAVHAAGVTNVTVWGNISGSTHIDLTRARVYRYDGATWGPPEFSQPILEVIYDRKWLETEFLTVVNSLSPSQGHRSLPVIHAVVTLLQKWFGQSIAVGLQSLGVVSEGAFEVPAGLVFAVPVYFSSGTWMVATDQELTPEAKEKLAAIVTELSLEKEAAWKHLNPPGPA
ncbi:putative malate dehydrogenase 1B [Erpetoichthys calabaricus]|uniref:putative malate dehydrogenase 1B n=1 Tax=Erpetoichthys calabaricus TaxID=27687 RepID=UPI0010A01C6F|nr:putative malate dehydrogenase 1B [Erpetoichthys calabaricus]